ncbi:pilus assembly protein PilP [Geotalea sp. SG265]|uniref:pilus assembly protein PilP n=1 Tax=Geotalea sp. SG265 TaxID=2922867 RepID=UPI001FAF8B4B|nr:pilus assembly protein PilP [Geotalea sp. SG265]
MRKSPSKLILAFVLGLLIIYAASGCKKTDEVPSSPPAPAPAQPKVAPKQNAAVQKPVSSARAGQAPVPFSFAGKKDPFKPLIAPQEATAAKTPLPVKRKIVDALPIQSYEVSRFVVTGIITGLRENKALLIDPAGKGYVVKTGMLIGDNGGRITKITASSLEVTESYEDGKKRIKNRKIVLPLAKKSKETSR